MKNLVIVESPAKAKTIEKYLGSDFKVLSSVGHIRQIPPSDNNAVDTKHDFKAKYEIDPKKKKVVSELKAATKAASEVWLATDPDREGEAIAWHLAEVLKLNPKTTKRIEYHEITKSAVEDAIQHPRTIDMDLVQAQQARQALDRLVGYELSPVVWRKVPGGKSAGRVQSPALRLIVEREREIEAFKPDESFKVSGVFKYAKDELKADLPGELPSEKTAEHFLKSLVGAEYSVADIAQTPGTRNPSAPFTTSSLQQEANSRFGYSAKTTMRAAQSLYQEGKITYMRTDSTSLSNQALGSIGNYIEKEFGKKYLKIRQFKTKSASAQEAHEAIRPTHIGTETAGSGSYEQKIYELIRNRTLASQMSPAELEKTTITIAISDHKEIFEAKGEVVVFDGFLKVYGGGKDSLLPKLAVGDALKAEEIIARQSFSKPPARYTEGSLVKKLESLSIGRPSTYATILENIQARGYVEKGTGEGKERLVIELHLTGPSLDRQEVVEKTGADKGKLLPTPAGEVLNDFLVSYFSSIVDYDFTAKIEEELDFVADGKLDHVKMLRAFYDPFHALIDKSGDIDRSKVVNARELGHDPKTKKPVLARLGRFGPMLQLGTADDPEKPRFAPLPEGVSLKEVTLAQALEMFKLPRLVGQTEAGEDIKSNIGRFGPYIQVGKLFVSIKPLDPFTITLDEARELYAAKLKAEAEKHIATFGKIEVLNGRYGPYVTDGTKNAKIPKDEDPKAVTEERALELLAAAPAKARRAPRRTSAKRTTTRKKSTTTKRRTKKS